MRIEKKTETVLEGSEAVAHAVRACKPDVISSYPISPQTHIVERLASMIANGQLSSQYVLVDAEFSAASVLAGASAAGGRAYTASTSQGLLLMTEVIYACAGMRMPFVITGANRAISAPISIQPDHQDAMSLRDSGIVQIYVESCQEAYDTHIAAFKIAEDPAISLPVMVCMDGWILTHSYERVELLEDSVVESFLPPFQPVHFLDVDHPKSWGPIADEDLYMEFRYAIHDAMEQGKGRIKEIFSELAALTGRDYGGLIEAYRTEGADVVLISMGSMSGTVKDAIDDLRAEGKPVGLVKLRCYRPFPHEEIYEAVKNAKVVAVLDSNISMSSEGAVGMDLKAKFYGRPNCPRIIDVIAGLGGKVINKKAVFEIARRAADMADGNGSSDESFFWLDLNRSVL